MVLSNKEERAPQSWRGTLVSHPTSSDCGIHSIRAAAVRRASTLSLHYEVVGDVSRLALPSSREARRADGLWEHTCFEAFISDDDAYYEFNFSPSGEWAFYRFERYRALRTSPAFDAPKIGVDLADDRLDLYTEFSFDVLAFGKAPHRLGLSTVIEEEGGDISYWALAHRDGPPDFHHASCFIGQIP